MLPEPWFLQCFSQIFDIVLGREVQRSWGKLRKDYGNSGKLRNAQMHARIHARLHACMPTRSHRCMLEGMQTFADARAHTSSFPWTHLSALESPEEAQEDAISNSKTMAETEEWSWGLTLQKIRDKRLEAFLKEPQRSLLGTLWSGLDRTRALRVHLKIIEKPFK